MKKIWIILLIFLPCSIIFPKDNVKIGAYAGYFGPKDTTLKEIYPKQDIIYGAKLGIRVWNQFSVWLSGMHYQKKGETTLLGDSTKLTLNPISLSLRYTAPLGSVNPYVGAGFTTILYKEEAEVGNAKGDGKGAILDAGLEFKISRHFHLDIGVAYSNVKVNPSGVEIELGGLQAGLAFLIVF